MLKLNVGNIFTDIEGVVPAELYSKLQRDLAFRPLGYEFSTMYNKWILDSKGKKVRRMWDGWRRQIWKSKNRKRIFFPTGLLSLAKQSLDKKKIEYQLVNCRVKPEQEMLGIEFARHFTMRDYQQVAVNDSCSQQRGIIQLPTGSGKTVIAAGIIQKLKVKPFVFFVTSIDLLTQAKESFEDILRDRGKRIKVGQIGGGVIDIRDINIMTVQTAVRSLGQEWDKDHKFDADDVDDKTPIQNKADVLLLLKNAKGSISDECQHWRAETCQLVARSLENSYYTYGCSVAPDSFLHISDGQYKFAITIECLYNQFSQNNEPIKTKNLWVESVDIYNLCPSWQKVKAILKHKTKNKVLQISAYNASIELTSDHSVFVLTNDAKLKVYKGSDLRVGDILVSPLYKNHNGVIPQDSKDTYIDIGDFFLSHLTNNELSNFIAVGFFPECKNLLHKKIGSQDFYRFFNRRKYHYLPFDVIKKYNLYQYLSTNEFYIRGKGKSNSFPKTISSLDLCFLTGIILGDGDIELTRIGITLGSKQEYITVSNFMKKLGLVEQLYKRGKVYYVRYNNSILSKLLKILQLNKKCCNKEIPKEIFSFGIESHRQLVQGLLLTDGHLTCNKSRRRESFNYTTRSRNLASGIHTLFRIHGTLISICRRQATKKFQDRIVKSCIDRDFILRCSTSASPLLDNIYGFSFSQQRIPTKLNFLQKLINDFNIYKNRIYLNMQEFEHLVSLSHVTKQQKHLCRNFKLLPIKSIKSRDEKFVYDLSVDKTENFLANGILMHNSATPCRDEGDDLIIQGCFGKKICELTASQLIRDKWLIQPSIKIVHVRGPKSKFRQWQQLYKDQVTENVEYNEMVASIANSYIQIKRLVLVLVTQIKHGKTLAEMIPGSVFLSGASSKKIREDNIQKLRNREISCICSTIIFDEGIDVKPLDTVILAGQGRSKVRAMQRIGRILRPFPGKTVATAVDFRIHQKYLLKHSLAREKMYRTEEEYQIEEIEPGE